MKEKEILKRTFNGEEMEFTEPFLNVISIDFKTYHSVKPSRDYVLMIPLFDCPKAKGQKCTKEIIYHDLKWLLKPSDYFNVNTCNCDILFDKLFFANIRRYLFGREYLEDDKSAGCLSEKKMELYDKIVENEKEHGLIK